jgi:hypothetical protein
LDSFVSHIPKFEGDILISAILISTGTPNTEFDDDLAAGPSAGLIRTHDSKWKAIATPTSSEKG